MRAVNAAGLQLIKDQEGLRLSAYRCKSGKLTIGWGHTGSDVRVGMNITRDTAERLFAQDVQKHASELERFITINVTSNQWGALVSLAFNMGAQKIGRSTLVKLLNAGDVHAAAEQFLEWKYLDSDPGEARVMVADKGLLSRRYAERELFLRGFPVRVG